MDTAAGRGPATPPRRGGRAGHERHVAAAAAAVVAAADALPPDRGHLRRRARVDPRRVAARPVRDRHGLPGRRRARRAPGGRRAASSPARSASGSIRTWSPRRIRTAPSTFTLHARNPAHDLQLGGDWMAFGTVGSPPNVADLDRGRRIGNREDYQNLLRLGQSLNAVHFLAGYPVEPVDIHHGVRHLHATYDALTLMDKADPLLQPGPPAQHRLPRDGPHRPRRRRRDARHASRRSSRSSTRARRCASTRRCSRGSWSSRARNQVVCITPFTLAGAMAPVTLAGALSEQNAEALAGMVLTQVVRPGAPVIYGGFTSNVDMQSGAPAFGTPEYMRTAMIGGQLARRYGVPYRSSNVSRGQRARRPGGVRVGVLAVGRDHGRRQPADARRRLDGGRPPRRATRR